MSVFDKSMIVFLLNDYLAAVNGNPVSSSSSMLTTVPTVIGMDPDGPSSSTVPSSSLKMLKSGRRIAYDKGLLVEQLNALPIKATDDSMCFNLTKIT